MTLGCCPVAQHSC